MIYNDARKSDWNYHWSNLCTLLAFTLHNLFYFIIYLLEDEYELSLGMLIHLQCIYNLWSIHAMFTTILYGFRMIWVELTQTDAVFSRTTVVSFFVQKEKFSECPGNPRRHFLELIRIFGERINARGPIAYPRDRPRVRPPISWAPWTSSDLNSNSISSVSRRKKSERKFHRVLRHGAAAKP